MNILVVGLGSMGKRRIRLMKELYPQNNIVGVDAREDRRAEVVQLFSIVCYSSIDEARKYECIDAAFVCTAPLSHNAVIRECLGNSWHVFTELNLVEDGYQENMVLAKKKQCKLFLSSTFFYREEIKYIRNKVDLTRRWNYVYHIGQYLPDWHPWENYKDFFVGNKRTNGCREIMAIELPWIIQTFGKVKEYHVISNKVTDLKIDYNDTFMIQLVHESGSKGTLIVDVACPVAVRKLELYSEHKYLRWEGTPESLFEYDFATDTLSTVKLKEVHEHREGYRAFVVENAYRNEIQEFFDVVQWKKEPIYGFEQDLEILHLINALENRSES